MHMNTLNKPLKKKKHSIDYLFFEFNCPYCKKSICIFGISQCYNRFMKKVNRLNNLMNNFFQD